MSKQITLNGWISIIPNAMYTSWVKRKLIKRGAKDIDLDNVSQANYETMQDEVSEWYEDVFHYIEEWLRKHKFIDLKKGSFMGGFCAELKENDVVTNWGAPLSGPRNKVTQIKEKYGRVVVYFSNLNDAEQAKIGRFEKFIERKFDCITDFC